MVSKCSSTFLVFTVLFLPSTLSYKIKIGPTGNECFFGDVLMPHPLSCGKFLMCSNNIEYEMDCPANLWFSFELQVCDYPENVDCSITSSTSPETTSSSTEETSPYPITTTDFFPSTSDETTTDMDESTPIFSDSTFLPTFSTTDYFPSTSDETTTDLDESTPTSSSSTSTTQMITSPTSLVSPNTTTSTTITTSIKTTESTTTGAITSSTTILSTTGAITSSTTVLSTTVATTSTSTTAPTTVLTTTESPCGTCEAEGKFPNPHDPTNKTYKDCQLLEDGTFLISCEICETNKVFVEAIGDCWFNCTKPTLDCDKIKYECSKDGQYCVSSHWWPPPDEGCHHYNLCYMDQHTFPDWRECRMACDIDPQTLRWMVFLPNFVNHCRVPNANDSCVAYGGITTLPGDIECDSSSQIQKFCDNVACENGSSCTSKKWPDDEDDTKFFSCRKFASDKKWDLCHTRCPIDMELKRRLKFSPFVLECV